MFYQYHQNNSGGSFVYDDERGISEIVIIEARSAHIANAIATEIGVYFDGISDGADCGCCGDRWYEAGGYSNEGDEVPSIYGTPVEDYKHYIRWRKDDGPDVYVHYADGSFVGITSPKGDRW